MEKEVAVGVEVFQLTLPRRERQTLILREDESFDLSTHAPVKGATLTSFLTLLHAQCFNSRSREGSDAKSTRRIRKPSLFQLTLPRRERLSVADGFATLDCFNSRSREGSDYHIQRYRELEERFNSRSREGSDRDLPESCQALVVSTHAPAKGAT